MNGNKATKYLFGSINIFSPVINLYSFMPVISKFMKCHFLILENLTTDLIGRFTFLSIGLIYSFFQISNLSGLFCGVSS